MVFLLCAGMAAAQSSGRFTATGSMITPRFFHAATLLPDGKVLIAGGGSATVELYDPFTGIFTATAASTASKFIGSATLLPDGRVLLIEAFRILSDAYDGTFRYTGGAELYDPRTGTVSATGDMIEGQRGYAANLPTNGKVLITGSGYYTESNCCSKAANPELYDPSTQNFSLAGPYAETGARSEAGVAGLQFTPATLLPDGTVLIASEPAAEILDPATNTFRLTASMTAEAYDIGPFGTKPDHLPGRTATLLLNGKVLLTGGEPGYGDFDTSYYTLNSAELYDFLSGTFTPTGDMSFARFSHAATLLTDGTVLITGGIGNPYGGTPVAELYNPETGAFSVAGNMESARVFHQATLLSDGRVLITGAVLWPGGVSPGGEALASAEIYTPPVRIPAPALFSFSGDGQGQGAIWHAATGQVASADNPASAGEALSMYTNNLLDGGVVPPQVAVGGRLADILFFGPAPGYSGYYQLNFKVPEGILSASDVSVRLIYLGRSSNEVTIGVR
ncbi:MAG: hypothetical protein JO307_27655 [Bryobacterales bacterium]|nr:hypothetical protein [Bryobacterales bacterium]MBV9398946.1 hypothetical protein [Bryobacterales bacterium]